MDKLSIGISSLFALFMIVGCGGGGSSGSPAPSTTQYLVGGVASGISGSELMVVLRINQEDSIEIFSDGPFSFSKPLPAGSTYQARLTVEYVFDDGQQRCALLNAEGIVGPESKNVLNLRCVTALEPNAIFGVDGLVLSWNDVSAQQYNVFALPPGVTDVSNYSVYPGAEMRAGVTSPLYAQDELALGKRTLIVEAEFSDGHRFNSPYLVAWNATPLGGPQLSSRVLTNGDSPYKLFNDLQIGPNATLEIEAGVHLLGNGFAAIQAFGGKVIVAGRPDSKVILEAYFQPGYDDASENCELHVSHAIIKDVSLSPGIGGWGTARVTDSRFEPSTEFGHYRGSELYLARNTFVDSGPIAIHWHRGSVLIENNVFLKNQGPAVQLQGSVTDLTKPIVIRNSFLSTDRVAVEVRPGSAGGDVDARSNYWGTTDETVIESMIYDRNDDLASNGLISYQPYLLMPHPDTPEVGPD